VGRKATAQSIIHVRLFLQLPEEESQPSTEVDLFVSAGKIMALDTGHRVWWLCKPAASGLIYLFV